MRGRGVRESRSGAFFGGLIVLAVLAGLVSAMVAARSADAAPDPSPYPRPTVESPLDSADVEALDRAERAGRSHVNLLIAAEEDRTAEVVAGIRNLGGTISVRQNRVGYVRARIPLGQAKRAAGLRAIEAVDVERRVRIDDPTPQAGSPAEPQDPPSPATPRSNPYMPLQDTGADTFGAVPEQDGRGVKVAILDTGIDLAHEAFQTTSTGDPKVIDWVNAIPPNSGDSTWVRTTGKRSGPFTAEGMTWTAPVTGEFAFGTLVEDRAELAIGEIRGDLNRNGIRGETIGVLQNRADNSVIVDRNMNRDFNDDPVLTDYRFDRDMAFLGTDDPGTPVEERMAYTVDTRRSEYDPASSDGSWVNIGISGNSHGSHVAGIVAGNGLFGGTMAGNAPGAELISIKVCPSEGGCTNIAMTEGMLYAAQAGADIANMSVGGLSTLNDGADAESAIYDRIVDDYGMSIFISAGNDGPGVNTVGDPSVARKVNSVAAGVSAETWLSNYGRQIDTEYSLFTFSSRGPALDGGHKPQMTAPGSAVSAIPPWQKGSPVDGIYPLPPGYGMMNGTSMSSPQAAGAAALLVGAHLDEFGSAPDPADLTRALTTAANPIAASPTHGQGAGLIDVPGAWDVLAAPSGSEPPTIAVEVPVNHVLSGWLLPTPGIGRGIFDREGVAPGVSYTRTLTLTRTSGAAGPQSFDVTTHGELSLSAPATVSLPLDEPVQLEVGIESGDPGVHSGAIRLDDPGTVGIDQIVPATVVTTKPPEPAISYSGTVRKGGDTSTAFRVPPGTSAFRVQLDGGGPSVEDGQVRFTLITPQGMPYEDLTSQQCFTPDTGAGCPPGDPVVRTVTKPVPGVWEVAVEAFRGSSAQVAPYTVTGSLLNASVSPDPDVIHLRGLGTIDRAYEATNSGGAFEGRLTGGSLLAIQRERLTIDQGDQLQSAMQVPAGADALTVSIGSPSAAAADLDLYLYHCGITCNLVRQSASTGAEESVTLPDPPAGSYVALIHGYDVPGGTTEFDYEARVAHPDLGKVEVDDTDAEREAGSRWSVGATVTVDQQVSGAWELGGALQVVSRGQVIERSDIEFRFDPDAPVVTITSAPPPSGPDRSTTVEFTVDDPEAEAQCRLDGADWEPCTSPHALNDLGDGDEGDHRFEVRARDLVGWGETAAAEFVVTADAALAADAVTATWDGDQARVRPTAALARARDGAPVAGRTVTFELDGGKLCDAVTNAAGQASCDAILPEPDRAGLKYRASFAGDDRYGAAGGEATVEVPDRPDPPDPACPAIKLGIGLKGFDAKPPWGKARRVAGVRVQLQAGRRVIAWIAPKLRYRVRGKARTASLERRTIRINGSRQLRFLIPKQAKRQHRKAGMRLKGSRVTFVLNAKARLAGTASACDQRVQAKRLRTRIVGVSSRAALRRLGW